MRSCASPLTCKERSAFLVLLSHPVSNMLVALDRGALKAQIYGIRYWTMHCVNLQRAWKPRGFRLVDDHRRSQKKRRCGRGSAVECSGGRVSSSSMRSFLCSKSYQLCSALDRLLLQVSSSSSSSMLGCGALQAKYWKAASPGPVSCIFSDCRAQCMLCSWCLCGVECGYCCSL